MSRRSIFVVIEGIDRCGKNLQAELLVQKFRELGEPTMSFTTPSYETATGRLVSGLLLGQYRMSGISAVEGEGALDRSRRVKQAELLAMECVLEANRYEVAAQIKRCLGQGQNAVCVRWWPSSLVYAQDDGLDTSRLLDACAFLPTPDVYVLLQVLPEKIRPRLDPRNRYEGDSDKQKRLAEAYRRLWDEQRWDKQRQSPRDRRWIAVSGDSTPNRVHEWVWQAVQVARGEHP